MKMLSIRIPEQLYERIQKISYNLETDISTAARALIARGAREIEEMLKEGKKVIKIIQLPEEIGKEIEILVIKYEKEAQ